MRVTKDRPGYIRKIAGMWRKSDRTQEAAVFVIDSTRPLMQYSITVPLLEDELESNKEFKKSKEIVEFVHTHPGCTRRLIQEGVAGSKEAIGERISDLITGGWIDNKGNDRSFILYITDLGKSHFNLLDAQITELKVN
jgi:predicted HTH transcriptional regulator